MIKQIDIGNFGSFSCFQWKTALRDKSGNTHDFKKVNILYGRNYSGKTTLSRIFGALETGHIPPKFDKADFIVRGDEGEVTQANLGTHGYIIRVYNRDFVSENLGFLTDQANGTIRTFAIVGEQNKNIEDQISAINATLGSVEGKTGLLFELDSKSRENGRSAAAHKDASESLDDKLRAMASSIRKNREYGVSSYNIDTIRKDIKAIKEPAFLLLTSEEQDSKQRLLKQQALPAIPSLTHFASRFHEIRKMAEELLSRKLTPTEPIQDLLNDAILQAWVKQGIEHHRNRRETCAFCGQVLPPLIWKALDAHFSQESSDLETSIGHCLGAIDREVTSARNTPIPSADRLYPEDRGAFEEMRKELEAAIEEYVLDLSALREALGQRKQRLFSSVTLPEPTHKSATIEQHFAAVNRLIEQSNGRTKTLEEDKEIARVGIRQAVVASFVQTIGYDDELTRIASLKSEHEASAAARNAAEMKVGELKAKIDALRSGQKDERLAADRINSLLTHFFGHERIRLAAKDIDSKTGIKFEVTRGGAAAYNLSEGECSLIAFCYFIAKLDEIVADQDKLIIYIDDPVSSLDGNHIFFLFSLIESQIAKPLKNGDGSNRYRYGQVFISTHNLEFLSYLKRLSLPRSKAGSGSWGSKQADSGGFLVERSDQVSSIALMPPYLRENITEFNYLFHQVFKCRRPTFEPDGYEPYYSFGNNLRKFLEALLFYKYPCLDENNNKLERISKFFGEDDPAAAVLVHRLDNEFSHLEHCPDRGFKPVDVPEISKVAQFVLRKIREKDPEQYSALLKSIGEKDDAELPPGNDPFIPAPSRQPGAGDRQPATNPPDIPGASAGASGSLGPAEPPVGRSCRQVAVTPPANTSEATADRRRRPKVGNQSAESSGDLWHSCPSGTAVDCLTASKRQL